MKAAEEHEVTLIPKQYLSDEEFEDVPEGLVIMKDELEDEPQPEDTVPAQFYSNVGLKRLGLLRTMVLTLTDITQPTPEQLQANLLIGVGNYLKELGGQGSGAATVDIAQASMLLCLSTLDIMEAPDWEEFRSLVQATYEKAASAKAQP